MAKGGAALSSLITEQYLLEEKEDIQERATYIYKIIPADSFIEVNGSNMCVRLSVL